MSISIKDAVLVKQEGSRRVKKARILEPADDDGDQENLEANRNRSQRHEADGDYEDKASRSQRKSKKKVAEDEDYDMDDEEEDNPTGKEKMCETGQIMKVYVQDFMCHRKFTVDFGRHVNFITGQNGSGKSAIVAALQLCLGATARSTGRGSNMASLIREGSEGPAVLQVTLLNEGSDAFQPEYYGNRITIERKIPKTGGSTFRLLNSEKILVSNRREDLEKILQVFNIFADNPCCILTQEESKKFIQGHEKEKYQFFIKASGLDITQEEIKHVSDQIDQAEASVAGHAEKLAAKKEQIAKLQNELNQLAALDKYDDEIKMCLAKSFYRDVYEANLAIETVLVTFKAKEAELEACEKDLKKAEKNLNGIEDFNDIENRMIEIQTALGEISSEAETKTTALNLHKKKANQLDTKRKELVKGRADHVNELDDVVRRIREYAEKARADADGELRDILENIDKVAATVETFKTREIELRNEKSTLSATVSDLEGEVRNVNSAIRGIDTSLQKMRNEKTDLQRTSDRIGIYGPRMVDILKAINADARQYKVPPIGPLGLYVKLDKRYLEYGQAIENALNRNTLTAFVVTCMEDRNVLNRCLDRYGVSNYHSIIIQTPAPKYRVDRIDVPGALTVLDTLTIENEVVFNAFVDQSKIESVILVQYNEDVTKAIGSFIEYRDGKRQFKNNILKAIDSKSNTISIRNGNTASNFDRSKYVQFLAEDVAEVIRGFEDRIRVGEEDLARRNRDQQEVKGSLANANKKVQEIDNELRNLADKMRAQNKRRQEFESKREECINANEVDISPLENERDQRDDAIKQMSVEIERISAEIDASAAELRVLNTAKNSVDKKKNEMNAALKQLETELNESMGLRENARKNFENAQKQCGKKQQALEETKNRLEALLNDKVDKEAYAREQAITILGEELGSEPIEVQERETKERLQKLVDSKKKLVEEGKRKAGLEGKSKEVLDRAVNKGIAAYNDEKARYDTLMKTLAHLNIDFEARQKLWSKQLKDNSKEVKRKFDVYLQKKGFSGDLEFVHARVLKNPDGTALKKPDGTIMTTEGTLHITCQTDNGDERTQCNDVRQLSGGERSYTTLCLLMALGHVIESPFRLMDEYDVFLDEMSRKITLSTLQKYALTTQQRGRQFIIITPQNLNDVKTSNDVRIRSLGAPIRSSAHGLQQQTLDMHN